MLQYHGPRLVLLLVFAFPACVDSSPDPSSPGPDQWCMAACDYTARCTEPVASTCKASCLSGNASYLSNMNSDYLSKVAPCIESATCTDWQTMSQNCYKDVAPTVTASAAVIDFCKTMSAKFFECFYADDDLTFCAGDFAPWGDASIARAKVCASAACTSLNDCFDNAFNGAN